MEASHSLARTSITGSVESASAGTQQTPVKELEKEGSLQGLEVGVNSKDGDPKCTKAVNECAVPVLTSAKDNNSKLQNAEIKYSHLSVKDLESKMGKLSGKIKGLRNELKSLNEAQLEKQENIDKKAKLNLLEQKFKMASEKRVSTPQMRNELFKRMTGPQLRQEIRKLEVQARTAPNNSPIHTDLYNAKAALKRNKVLSMPLDILERKIKTLEKKIEGTDQNDQRKLNAMNGELKLMKSTLDAKVQERSQIEKYQKMDIKELEKERARARLEEKPEATREAAEKGVGTRFGLASGVLTSKQGEELHKEATENITQLNELPKIAENASKREKMIKDLQGDIKKLELKRKEETSNLREMGRSNTAEENLLSRSVERLTRQIEFKKAEVSYLSNPKVELLKEIVKMQDQIANEGITQMAEGHLGLAQLPTKSEPQWEKVMHRMADICSGHPPSPGIVGSITLISSDGDMSSGGVYAVAVQHGNATVNLMSWKPRDEAPGMPDNLSGADIPAELKALHPAEEGVVSECIVHTNPLTDSRACLAQVNHRDRGPKFGVLMEFFPSEGTIQGNRPTKRLDERSILRDKFPEGPERDQALKAFDEVTAEQVDNAREWGLHDEFEMGSDAYLPIWSHIDSSTIQIQEGIDTFYDNTDENAGNELIKSKMDGKEKRVELHNLDFERTNPAKWPEPGNYNPSIFADTTAMNAPVDSKTKKTLLKFDVEKEIVRIDDLRAKGGLPPLSDERKDMMRARQHLVEVGLNNNCTMEQIRRVRMSAHPENPDKTLLQAAYETAKSEKVPAEQFWKRVDHHLLKSLSMAIEEQQNSIKLQLKKDVRETGDEFLNLQENRLKRVASESKPYDAELKALESAGKKEEAEVVRKKIDSNKMTETDAKMRMDPKRIQALQNRKEALQARLEDTEKVKAQLLKKVSK